MAFKDFFKNMLNMPEDDYEDEYYEEGKSSIFDDEEETAEEKKSAAPAPKQSAKKSDFGGFFSKSSPPKNENEGSQIQVVLVKPTGFEDEVTEIAAHLCRRKTVVLNLESANRETSRRLLDFLSGTAFAVGGNIKRVANSTYIIAPGNVNVLGELIGSEVSDAGENYFG